MGTMAVARRRAPARESDLSRLFFEQGERNAAEDVLAYQRQMTESARRRRRRWLTMTAVLVASAVAVAVSVYLASI